MKKISILLFALNLVLNNVYAQNTLDSIKNRLVGKWFSPTHSVELTYTSDGKYHLTSGDFSLKTDYQISLNTDSIIVYHSYTGIVMLDRDSEKDDVPVKNLIFVNRNELVQANYKVGKDINDHIDEVDIFYKKGVNMDSVSKQNDESLKTRFLLPVNFSGVLMLAYNQPNYSVLGSENVITIPKSGLLKIKNKEDIYKFIKGRFKFYYNDGELNNGNKTEIILLDPNRNYTESEWGKYKDYDVCIYPLGYNQMDRQSINEIFGEKIDGNIEMYEVAFFKNLIAKYFKN